MRAKICLSALFLFLLPVISYAQNQNNSLVQELYVKSGMKKQNEQFPSLMQALLDISVQKDTPENRIPESLLSKMKASIPEAFAPEGMKQTILKELTEKLSAKEIRDVLHWLDSPIGKKCTQLEEAASTPEAQAEMQKYADKRQDSPQMAERLKKLEELDSALKLTESTVDSAINMQVAVALGMIATLPPDQRRPPEEVEQNLEKTRPLVEEAARKQVIISNLYTYRSLTEAEIQQYTEFSKSPSGSKYNSVVSAALKKAILEGAVKWGKLIGEAAKERKGDSEA